MDAGRINVFPQFGQYFLALSFNLFVFVIKIGDCFIDYPDVLGKITRISFYVESRGIKIRSGSYLCSAVFRVFRYFIGGPETIGMKLNMLYKMAYAVKFMAVNRRQKRIFSLKFAGFIARTNADSYRKNNLPALKKFFQKNNNAVFQNHLLDAGNQAFFQKTDLSQRLPPPLRKNFTEFKELSDNNYNENYYKNKTPPINNRRGFVFFLFL